METPYEDDVKTCVQVMNHHGVILYPTDTIWGLGCSAQSEQAIDKIFEIKKRSPQKSFVLLMTDVKQLSRYLANPLPDLETILSQFTRPTTIIYQDAINLPQKLISQQGSIAVRITRDPFCRSLIRRMRQPLVSTSANISGEEAAANFSEMNEAIKLKADYVVQWRQDDRQSQSASAILKLEADGSFTKIR
jgi:L-threonylcarbamoyladenylate synthase